MFFRITNGIFILYILLFLQLHGCANPDPGSIKFGLNAAPVTLDPRYDTDAASSRINRLIYARLVDFDQNFNVVPSLATWRVISPTHYRFTLGKHDRRFHNGDYLTAQDIKATYESVLDKNTASPHRATLADIDRIIAVNPDEVDFYLKKPDLLFPGKLVIGIMPSGLIDIHHPFNRKPVGSGNFRLVNWSREDKISLIRSSDRQAIEFITVKDPTVRVLKLLRGEVDLIQGDLSPEVIEWLDNREEVSVSRQRGNTFTYLGFNMLDKDTGNIDVRKAIAYAIDRNKVIRHVLDDTARVAGAILPPDHWSGHKTLTGYSYNPDKARLLLQNSGYDAQNPLHIIYKTSNNPLRLRLATIFQFQLKQVGIDLEIQSYDWGTFYADIKSGRFQLYGLSWVGLNMPDIFRYVYHSSSIPPVGANRGRFLDSHADALIEAAEITDGLKQQSEIYRQLQEYLYERLPYIPLWYEDNVVVTRKNIDGYHLTINGNYDGLQTVTRRH